jgi:hypothetical protein
LVVVNAIYPPVPKAHRSDDEATQLWIRRRHVNEMELKRLGKAWKGPTAEIPLEPIDAGPTLVGVIGEHLTTTLEV